MGGGCLTGDGEGDSLTGMGREKSEWDGEGDV